MAASAKSEDGDMGFQIAPMVDVVFVLLLFFMAIASLKVSEEWIKVPLPGGVGKTDRTVIRIDITEEGVVSVNDTICGNDVNHALPDLRAWLNRVMSAGDTDPVVIHPAPGTRQERIIDVLNACAAENVKGVAFN